MKDDLISRQAAIEDIKECAQAAHSNYEWDMEQGYINAIECLEELPSAQPKQTDCEYCHEDSDGYVRPLEKNCHAFVRYGINGWEISLKAKGWSGSAKIKYCPMCGRELKHE